MRNSIKFNGKSLADFDVYVSGNGTYNSPKRDYEWIEIPGHDGSFVIDNHRLENIEITYPAFIVRDFSENYAAMVNYLLSSFGYQRLEDTYHPTEYRLALFTGPIEPTMTNKLQEGSFDLKFTCKPQRYLKSGDVSQGFIESGSIINPTLLHAKPLIRVYGTGEFKIGTGIITINKAGDAYIDIDCEIMDTYEGTNNRNSNITVEKWPELVPGSNDVVLGDGITKIEVKPRWWKI